MDAAATMSVGQLASLINHAGGVAIHQTQSSLYGIVLALLRQTITLCVVVLIHTAREYQLKEHGEERLSMKR